MRAFVLLPAALWLAACATSDGPASADAKPAAGPNLAKTTAAASDEDRYICSVEAPTGNLILANKCRRLESAEQKTRFDRETVDQIRMPPRQTP